MKKAAISEPEIRFLEEKELLEGLLQITGNNLGAAHSLLDRVIDKTRDEFATTLREIQNNIGRNYAMPGVALHIASGKARAPILVYGPRIWTCIISWRGGIGAGKMP